MKRSLMSLVMMTLFSLPSAHASCETVLMVSVDKKVVTAEEVSEAVAALNVRDVNASNCFVNSDVIQYIDYMAMPNAPENLPYYGVALLKFEWQCDDYARTFLTKWQDTLKYTVWSNAAIGPWPAYSGSN